MDLAVTAIERRLGLVGECGAHGSVETGRATLELGARRIVARTRRLLADLLVEGLVLRRGIARPHVTADDRGKELRERAGEAVLTGRRGPVGWGKPRLLQRELCLHGLRLVHDDRGRRVVRIGDVSSPIDEYVADTRRRREPDDRERWHVVRPRGRVRGATG